ncbi:MAG: acetolactate synthase small subunit [Bacteroidales bacterium]|nr:acetolactate synthase small subunit [Bacteroidales bacterium]
MEKVKEFTITAFSENSIGLLNRITIIFTRRHLNIDSLTVSESAIQGIYKFTIVVNTTPQMIEKVVKQIEKLVDVLKAFYLNGEDIVHQEIALYKVPTEALLNSNDLEKIIRRNNARILEVTPDYTVIEKTGHKAETQELFEDLNQFGVLQFTRSGRIAITKMKVEMLSDFLKLLDKDEVVYN